MAMNVKGLLQDIAEYQSEHCFTPDYIREDNEAEREEDGLGIAISQWAEWDGLKIMRVFRDALTDSNFHQEAAVIDELLAKYDDVLHEKEDDDGSQ